MSRTRSHGSPLPTAPFRIERLEARSLLAADPLTVIVGAGAAKSVQFTDASGTQAQVLLTGAGAASLNFEGTGLSQSANARGLVVNGSGISLTSISINGTNAKSIFQIITVKKHALSVGTIMVGGALNRAAAAELGGRDGRVGRGRACASARRGQQRYDFDRIGAGWDAGNSDRKREW